MANEKDKDRNTAPVADDVKEVSNIIQCNIHNPNRGRRVIYDGIEGSQRPIVIDGFDTKYKVTIARWVAEELRDRNRIAPNSDLVIGPPTEAPAKSTWSPQPEPAAF